MHDRTKNIFGGSFPTRTTNPVISVIYFLRISFALTFCRNHVSVGRHSEYGEEVQLVIPEFMRIISIPG